jgi:thiamine biosynthesis protein ThiI
MRSIVIHYQEIALKGKNRPWFISRLVRHVKLAMADLDVREVRSIMGRIEVVLGSGTTWEVARDRLRHIFGIANFAVARRTAPDLDVLVEALLPDLHGRSPRSFRVTARRADKRFPMPSPDIERLVGARVQAAFGWPVDLDNPDLTIRIEFVTKDAFYSFGKERGPGGLPVGVSGRVVCLLSGGIDSPVAAWRMMRRGCSVHLVHFHSYPFHEATSQEKVREIARLLARYQLQVRLYHVPFGQLQRQVVVAVPPALRIVIYRRLMMRIADAIARQVGARALVTGEVVGQVASQTLDNMAVISSAATLPILRPLVGMDKEEITAEAERIGSFPISIIPDQDCCQLFTPRHPATRARPAEIEDAERMLPTAEMVRDAAGGAVVEDYGFPVVQSPVRSDR